MATVHVTHAFPAIALPRALPGEFVRRHRLAQRLQAAPDGALAVIVAPAGYGKSSLISEWAETEERRFIACRPDDTEPVIAALDPDDEPTVVVLDDAHRFSGEALRNVLATVRERLPVASMVAIVGRREPPLPLGRLRAHRQLVELRVRDLAMTPAEAAALLKRAGLELDFGQVQALVQHTEGWPAALYLAALALTEHHDAPEGIGAFGGEHHLLAEYIRDEVLAELPRTSLTFLRRTSILDELTGPVCDVTLEEPRTALRLAKVAQTTPLLEPLEPTHERYRCHPLLREALAAELRRHEPELIPRLHARASSWYSARGQHEAAIEHAVAAGDAERAGTLMWSAFASLLTEAGVEQLNAWLGSFNRDVIAGSPTLTICAACGALADGDSELAVAHARELSAADHHRGVDPTVLAAAELIGATAPSTEVAAIRRAAAHARRALPPNSPWQAACRWLEGAALQLGGDDRVRSAQLLEEAIALGRRAAPVIAACALGHRAMLAMEDQEWDLAGDFTDEADAILRSKECELPITALTLATIAAVRARGGRAAEAKADLQRAGAALSRLDDGIAWFGAETRLVLAHASLYLADVAGARTLLAQASRQARRFGDAGAFSAWFSEAWSYLDTLAETSLTGPSALTIAELRVLRFLPSCRPFREIADQLGVSANTVKTQAHAVYRKLGAGSRSEAVLLARQAGLLGQ